jgi:hypothetical protein
VRSELVSHRGQRRLEQARESIGPSSGDWNPVSKRQIHGPDQNEPWVMDLQFWSQVLLVGRVCPSKGTGKGTDRMFEHVANKGL